MGLAASKVLASIYDGQRCRAGRKPADRGSTAMVLRVTISIEPANQNGHGSASWSVRNALIEVSSANAVLSEPGIIGAHHQMYGDIAARRLTFAKRRCNSAAIAPLPGPHLSSGRSSNGSHAEAMAGPQHAI